MRTNQFLENKLEEVWTKYFSDMPKQNIVEIKFGRIARKRLGCIRTKRCPLFKDRMHTQITINGHFKCETVPEYVIEATIAHELCHYAHGFGSPLPQLSQYPHRGGKVDQEMDRRGLSWLVADEIKWLNSNWTGVLKQYK